MKKLTALFGYFWLANRMLRTQHTFYLPSRLNNTGCDALLVTVNILGTKPVKKLKIPFMCGE